MSALQRAGISDQPWLAAVPLSLEQLRAPGQRVDWEVWVALSERLESLVGGPQALEDFMCDAARTTLGSHQFERVAQLISSPVALYRLNSQWGVPNQYRNMRSSCESLENGWLCVSLGLLDGYGGSTAVFRASRGILRGLPQLIGLPPATIHESELSDRRVRLVLEPPRSRTVFSQLARLGRRAHGISSLLGQLGEQELELDEKRATLARQTAARLRADAALQNSEARWQALAENAPGIILLLTRDGVITSASRAFADVPPPALLNRDLRTLVAQDCRAGLTDALRDVQGKSAPRDVDLSVVAADGAETHYSCRLGWMQGRSEDQTELCGFLTDVTERRRVQRELEQREAELQSLQRLEALGRLAGGVAHDFNNLLTVICGGTDLLLRESSLREDQREELVQIQQAGARAAALTRQLLTFSRQQLINPEVLDLQQSVAGAQGMLQRLVGEDIHVALAGTFDGLSAKIDRGQFEQILMNLAANARDAMPRGGTLTFSVNRVELQTAGELGGYQVPPGDYVELAVRDSGIGMSRENAQRIFEPFFTTKVASSGKSGGTGLGLAIVRGIVMQNRGYVGVESTPGQGSTFRLLFPRTTELPIALATAELEPIQNGSARVLLVEDDAQVRGMAQRVLRDRGYAVTVCERGSEALEAARLASFDLLLSDVVMPEISGPELALMLTRRAPNMKVLFMSGYAEDAIVDRGVVNPGVALLPKPFTPDTLLRSVQNRLSDPKG